MANNRFIPWQSTLTNHACPYKPCPGRLAPRVLHDYTIAGQRVVASAVVNVCNCCGEHLITDWEWHRLEAAIASCEG